MKKINLLTAVLCVFSFSTMADDVNQDSRAKVSLKNQATQALYGAELYSLEKVHFGKFIIRMKMLSEPGVVSSFFTYDNESWQGEGRPWREIDFETIGSKPDQLQTNLITGNAAKREHSERMTNVPNINDYKNYTLEWTPKSIIWKVNDEIVREETAADSQQVKDMADTPQTYRSNVWISEVIDWVGRFEEAHLPKYQVIDWIEFYDYKDNGSFELSWRDDFNSFDTKRWGKAEWSFDTNMVTFAPENLQIIDGKLVFALTSGTKGIDKADFLKAQK